MSFSISARNLSHIKRKVESGKYASADEVLVTALALLDERDDTRDRELPDMRERVRRGTQQADAGELIPAGEVFEELRERNAAAAKQRTLFALSNDLKSTVRALRSTPSSGSDARSSVRGTARSWCRRLAISSSTGPETTVLRSSTSAREARTSSGSSDKP